MVPRIHRTAVVSVLFLGCLLAGGTTGAGTCTTAQIDEPFLLADGVLRPPGALTVCREQAFTPGRTIHRVDVDGLPVGMAFSRDHLSEGPAEHPASMLFVRDREGRLNWVGYTVPGRDHMHVFVTRG